MGKIKTITVVKSHYIGEKSMTEVFSGILKRQIEQGVLKSENLIYDTAFTGEVNCGKIRSSNLLSESEELCTDNR